jgi:hypothetical protein
MKRSFRVATVFTGAAACAALAPAAHAASAAPGATARITPDTTAHDCSKGSTTIYSRTNEVHLYYSSKEHHTYPACIFGSGSPIIWGRGKRFGSYCAGAWSGYLYIDGGARRFTAGNTVHQLYNASVSGIMISRENYNRLFSTCANW